MPRKQDQPKPGDSAADLRAVIHSLRMGGFCQVEPEALSHIQSLIKELPTPEELTGLMDAPEAMSKVREAVGYILAQIDHYSQKNPEFKARFEAKRGFPPRYKVLDWSCVKKNVASCLRRYVIASDELDRIGEIKKASRMLSIADRLSDVLSTTDGNCEEATRFFRECLSQYQEQLVEYSKELIRE